MDLIREALQLVQENRIRAQRRADELAQVDMSTVRAHRADARYRTLLEVENDLRHLIAEHEDRPFVDVEHAERVV